MDNEMLGLLFRGIERLIIVGAAFTAIWSGFRLFSTVISDRGSFEGALGEWKVKLQRIAPGVFFACFGAIILLFAVSSPFTYSPTAPIDQDSTMPDTQRLEAQTKYIGGYPGTNEQIRAQNLIVDLTTVTGFLSDPDLLKSFSLDNKMRVADAVVRLTNHRMSLIDVAFGKGWRQNYDTYVGQFKPIESAKDSLSDNEYRIFSTIHSSLSFNPSN